MTAYFKEHVSHFCMQADEVSTMVPGHSYVLSKEETEMQSNRELIKRLEEKDKLLEEKDKLLEEKDKQLEECKKELEKRNNIIQICLAKPLVSQCVYCETIASISLQLC